MILTTAYLSFFGGLLIGSFLNVAIYRVPRHLSVSKPARSFCPKCNTTLKSWENIPLISWIIQLGKCRHCQQPISGQYPLVELLSGIGAAASTLYFGVTPTALVVYCLVASLIVISFIDLEFKIIPNVISFPGMIIGCIIGIVSQYTNIFDYPVSPGAFDTVLGFLLGGGIFYAIGWVYYLFTKKIGLGGGDIKLLAMTGSILGWQSVPQTIILGSLIGSVVGITVMIVKKSGRQIGRAHV